MINCPACGSLGLMAALNLAGWHCSVCGADFSEDGELLADDYNGIDWEDDADYCDTYGHDWILEGDNAGLCANCGVTRYEEEGP